jgi:subtilisin family serine protease
VAAIDSNRNVAGFSQKNDRVDLAAPGVSVYSTLPTNYGGYVRIKKRACRDSVFGNCFLRIVSFASFVSHNLLRSFF